MSSRSHWSRFSAFLTLLFHLAVVGAGPVADARLHMADESLAALHIESADAPPCSPGHNHDYCQICRTLQCLDGPGETGARLPISSESEIHPSYSARSIRPALAALSSLGPRAPPLA